MNSKYSKTIKLNPKKELPVIGVKILDEQYAEDFVKRGQIHFSNPGTWRDSSFCNGKQYDPDDGCFCFSLEENDEVFRKAGRRFIKKKTREGWKYFEDTDSIVGTCFFGIKKEDFKDGVAQYGVRHIPSKEMMVSKEFFLKFREKNDESKNQKAIIIFDLYKFYDLVVSALLDVGFQKQEVFISTVYYVKKSIPFCSLELFPFEYFLKDEAFSEQAELRIMIASNNERANHCFQENNNNLIIGNISSFAIVQDNYDEDLYLSIQENKLLYSLATPVSWTFDDKSFKELIIELYQILQNQLPGPPKEAKELESLVKPLIEYLKDKYGVLFRDDWRLFNVPYDLFLTLPDLYKGLCMTFAKPDFNDQ